MENNFRMGSQEMNVSLFNEEEKKHDGCPLGVLGIPCGGFQGQGLSQGWVRGVCVCRSTLGLGSDSKPQHTLMPLWKLCLILRGNPPCV